MRAELIETLEPHRRGAFGADCGTIKATWLGMAAKKNVTTREEIRDVHHSNEPLLDQVCKGEMDISDAKALMRTAPQEIKGEARCAFVTSFRKETGLSITQSARTCQKELAKDDPILFNKIQETCNMMKEHNVPEDLVANTDEIWRTRHRLTHQKVLNVDTERKVKNMEACPTGGLLKLDFEWVFGLQFTCTWLRFIWHLLLLSNCLSHSSKRLALESGNRLRPMLEDVCDWFLLK